jgi:hypothetical protein
MAAPRREGAPPNGGRLPLEILANFSNAHIELWSVVVEYVDFNHRFSIHV